ncbi:MAG: hypothetical protein ABI851_02770 [Saprospiraceae bacterium]
MKNSLFLFLLALPLFLQTCTDAGCDCYPGYIGPDCTEQETPSHMTITKVELISLPYRTTFEDWDMTNGADIYPSLSLANTKIWESPSQYENAERGLKYEFIPNPVILIIEPLSKYSISLYDRDEFDPDDLMGEINFTPYSSTGGFPVTKTIEDLSGLSFRLTFTYLF